MRAKTTKKGETAINYAFLKNQKFLDQLPALCISMGSCIPVKNNKEVNIFPPGYFVQLFSEIALLFTEGKNLTPQDYAMQLKIHNVLWKSSFLISIVTLAKSAPTRQYEPSVAYAVSLMERISSMIRDAKRETEVTDGSQEE
eukprot:gene35030-43195_t